MKLEPIFISSTFADFHEERNRLRNHFFHKLNKLLQYESIHFHRIDLRWGIENEETEEATEKKILDRCLQEIKRSHKYMIIFLGDRYGTLVDQDLLKLQSIHLELPTERLSVTSIEYLYALTHLKSDQHIFFCNRTILNINEMPDGIRQNYVSGSKEDIQALTICKDYLRVQPNVTTIDYEMRWNVEKEYLEPVKDFTEPLIDAILSKVERIAIGKESATPYDLLEHIFLETSPFYVEREDEKIILELVNDNHVALYGEKGTGKTTILSKVMRRLLEQQKYVVVAAPIDHLSEKQMIEGWLQKIALWTKKTIPISLQNSLSITEFLTYVESLEQPLYVIVDNVQSFQWIKELVKTLLNQKPNRIYCIVYDPNINIRNLGEASLHEIQKLTYEQIANFLSRRFEFEGKELTIAINNRVHEISNQKYKYKLYDSADGVSDKLIADGLSFKINPHEYEEQLLPTITNWVQQFKKTYKPSKHLTATELNHLIQNIKGQVMKNNNYYETMMIDRVIFPLVAEAYEIDVLEFISDTMKELNLDPRLMNFFTEKTAEEKVRFHLPISWIEIMYLYLDSVNHFTEIPDLVRKLVDSQEELIAKIIELRYPSNKPISLGLLNAMRTARYVLSNPSLEQLFMQRFINTKRYDYSVYEELKFLLGNFSQNEFIKIFKYIEFDWDRKQYEYECLNELLLFFQEQLDLEDLTAQKKYVLSKRLITAFCQDPNQDNFSKILEVIKTFYGIYRLEDYHKQYIDTKWLYDELNKSGFNQLGFIIEKNRIQDFLNELLPEVDPEPMITTLSVAQLLRHFRLSNFSNVTLSQEQNAIQSVIEQLHLLGN